MALPPPEVIESDSHHLARSQSVGGNQQKHRVVAQSFSRGSANGSQKGADRLPRKGTRQLFEPVKARRINLAGEVGGNPVVNRQESEESSQRADIGLEASSAQAPASFGDVGFDVGRLEILQRDLLVIQVLEKAVRCVSVQ